MILNKENIISELQLRNFGAKNWLRSDLCKCFGCNDSSKFGVLFTSDGALVRCFKCGYSTSLFNYLRDTNRGEIIKFQRSTSLRNELLPLTDTKTPLEVKQSKISLPFGYKRIYFDDYLEERLFEPWQYNQYEVGTSTERRLKDCLVFVLRNREGEIQAWLSRSKHSKQWHETNFKDYKAGKCELKLRYNNSQNTNFSEILLGENEIVEETKTILLCEGLFDKANVDRCLNLRENKEKKCCATFGNSLTDEQAKILLKHGVENVVIMWDQGTNTSSKKASVKVSKSFKSVRVCEFKDAKIDAGDSTKEQLEEILSNSKDYFTFYMGRMNEFKLKQ
jgi:hypothetical protein